MLIASVWIYNVNHLFNWQVMNIIYKLRKLKPQKRLKSVRTYDGWFIIYNFLYVKSSAMATKDSSQKKANSLETVYDGNCKLEAGHVL